MTPQSVGLVRAERRLVEEFYNCPLHVNAGLILASFLSENRRAFDRRQSRHVLEQQRIAHELPEVSQSGSASHLGDGGALIKEFNCRVKGTEKSWNRMHGCEAILQVRNAVLCDDRDHLSEFILSRPGCAYYRPSTAKRASEESNVAA